MDLQLTNKRALITGGSIGIGRAVAEGLAEEGVDLILCARNMERLEKVGKEIANQYHVKVDTFQTDVTSAESLQAFMDQVKKKYHSLDILINNAGQGSNETIQEASDDRWYYYWDLHVMAAVRLCRGLAPLLKVNGGVILNNSSICATQPLGYEPIYNTTKAALSMFSKCLANELIPFHIRVNTVNPGLILTPEWEKAAVKIGKEEGISPEEFLDRTAKEYAPIGRFASPEELAKFFVFLCSPMASYSVGSSYYVDGGWLNVVK